MQSRLPEPSPLEEIAALVCRLNRSGWSVGSAAFGTAEVSARPNHLWRGW